MIPSNHARYASITPEERSNVLVDIFYSRKHRADFGIHDEDTEKAFLIERISLEIELAVKAAIAAERVNAKS